MHSRVVGRFLSPSTQRKIYHRAYLPHDVEHSCCRDSLKTVEIVPGDMDGIVDW